MDIIADTRTRWFAGIVQERIASQMQVLDWFEENPSDVKCIYIRHDKDKRPQSKDGEEIQGNDAENDDGCEVSENGLILPHFHLLCYASSRISPNGFTKSFGSRVHFQRCSNPRSYFQYLTHRSFIASLDVNKHIYELSEIQTNDKDFLDTFLSGSGQELDIERRTIELIQACGSVSSALDSAVNSGEWDVFKEIKAHSYFYYQYFKKKGE